jgi:hypothetical protein
MNVAVDCPPVVWDVLDPGMAAYASNCTNVLDGRLLQDMLKARCSLQVLASTTGGLAQGSDRSARRGPKKPPQKKKKEQKKENSQRARCFARQICLLLSFLFFQRQNVHEVWLL